MPPRPDWAVHVALWERGRAGSAGSITAAAVAQPSLDVVYASDSVGARTSEGMTFLVSDSRPPTWAAPVAEAVGGTLATMGSAGAKAMAVVRGAAAAYLHAGGQWEWDSAAPVGVALAAGLHATRVNGSELIYNSANPYLPDLLICRPELAEPLLSTIAAVGGRQ